MDADFLLIQLSSSTPGGAHVKKKKHLFPTQHSQGSLSDWLHAADPAIQAKIAQIPALYANAADIGLGYYTYEQEADEIGVEIAARSGLTKDQLANVWIGSMKASAANNMNSNPIDMSLADCESLLQSGWGGWSEVGGKYPRVLLGGWYLSEPHHGDCFRLYNDQREWTLNQMDTLRPTQGGLVLDPNSWQQIQSGASATPGTSPISSH